MASKLEQEARRIRWRAQMLATPLGVERLTELVRAGVKERDLGPDNYPRLLESAPPQHEDTPTG
jgi:hypothetical protein